MRRVISKIRSEQSYYVRAIKEAVDLIHSKCSRSYFFDEDTFRFSIVKLAKELGFSIYRTNLQQRFQVEAGVLISPDLWEKPDVQNDKVLLVANGLSPAKARYALALSLAYYLFDFKNEYNVMDYQRLLDTTIFNEHQSTNLEESVTDFAMYLLMPDKTFNLSYKEAYRMFNGVAFDIVSELTRTFDVPAFLVIRRIEKIKENL